MPRLQRKTHVCPRVDVGANSDIVSGEAFTVGGSKTIKSTKSKGESELLGVSIDFLRTDFLDEVEAIFGVGADPDFYKVNDKLFHGPTGKGFEIECPRTGLPGSSYVDAIDTCHTGPATVMLSWTWQYSVRTVVDTLVDWCESKHLDPRNVFVWQCALCCNQYRVQERRLRGEWESFETFRAIFEKRVKTIGHVLAILAPWKDPLYVKRAWCIFEFYVAATTPGVRLETVCASSEKQSMVSAIASGWLLEQGSTCLWFTVDVRNATTSSPDDKNNILRCIDPTATDFNSNSPQLDALNDKVQGYLREWCVSVLVEALDPSSAFITDPKKHMMAAVCAAAIVNGKDSLEGTRTATRILRGSLAMARDAGAAETHEYASLSMIEAIYTAFLGDSISAIARLREAISWDMLLPKRDAPPGWEWACHPMPTLFLAMAVTAQGRFRDAMAYLHQVEAEVVAGRDADSFAEKCQYRSFLTVKACALHGLGRIPDANHVMFEAKAFMEQIGDTHGS